MYMLSAQATLVVESESTPAGLGIITAWTLKEVTSVSIEDYQLGHQRGPPREIAWTSNLGIRGDGRVGIEGGIRLGNSLAISLSINGIQLRHQRGPP